MNRRDDSGAGRVSTEDVSDEKTALQKLHDRLEAARGAKRLTKSQVARLASLSRTTVSQAFNSSVPPSIDTVSALADVLGLESHPLLDLRADACGATVLPSADEGCAAGRSDLVRVRDADPRLLGVHRAIEVEGAAGDLPAYVRRDTDSDPRGVRAAIEARAAAGGLVLLVGGSSVGKTRCAVEAVRDLLPDWWLLHPTDASVIRDLVPEMSSAMQVVVWLDEMQRYLGGVQGLTAATVRALLQGPGQVVLIGTLWPGYFDAFTALPGAKEDSYAAARAVVELAQVVHVDDEFTGDELDRAHQMAADDPRIHAVLQVSDYGFTQSMAAAPQLVARWREADPYAAALLNAAVDAERLFAGEQRPFGLDVPRARARRPLSAGLLRAAAPGYCDDRDRARAPDNWFDTALAYATQILHGAAAALEPVAAPGEDMGKVVGYVPADYLMQHVGRLRAEQLGPTTLWNALSTHLTDARDLYFLADTADRRGLYRYTAILYKRAILAGDTYAALSLWNFLTRHRYDTAQAAVWIAHNTSATDSYFVVRMIGDLPVAAGRVLADRVADHVDVTNPLAAARALSGLIAVGAKTRARALANRAAEAADTTDPSDVASLLQALYQMGAQSHAQALVDRSAKHINLTDAVGVNHLLAALERIGGHAQVRMLAARADLATPGTIAHLLEALSKAGAQADVQTLADRAASHAVHTVPGTSHLIDVLVSVGATAQARALANRAAHEVDLTNVDVEYLHYLWESLNGIVAETDAEVLADRIARRIDFTNPRGVCQLLEMFHEAGAEQQVGILADRIAHHADVYAPRNVGILLSALTRVKALPQVQVLANRAVGYNGPIRSDGLIGINPIGVLLEDLHRVGATAQVQVLADRAVRRADLTDSVGTLIAALYRVGATAQIQVLADRAAHHIDLDSPTAIHSLLEALHQVGATAQTQVLLARQPAHNVNPTDSIGTKVLVDLLRTMGAETQAQVLASRIKTTSFAEYLDGTSPALADRFRYGQEPDGTPSKSWTWNDLP